MKFSARDLSASLVVFLVALPLCLGISVASGAPPLSGIIAGIIGGIVVGAISGSRVGVSGPAAGLAVIVAEAIASFGGLDGGGLPIFLAAVVLAGLLQIGLGLVKAGIVAYFFPTSVIKGMLAGIGIIIFIKQIPHALGDDREPEGSITYEQMDGETTSSEVTRALDYINPGAVIITLVGLALIILFQSRFVKQNKVLSQIPGALLAVLAGVALYFAFLGTAWEIGPEHTVNIPILDGLGDAANLLTFPDWSAFTRPDVWLAGATIAIVASIETLLCVEATDKLDPRRDVTDTNRELLAQGIGNTLSGLVGGLPITQVIVRSSANLQAQAETKASAIIHGVWLTVAVLFLPAAMNYIPMAALAAVLMVVGYKLADPALFVKQYRKGWTQFLPFVVTVGAVYFTDLLTGILIGVVVATIFLLWRNFQTPYFTPAEAAADSGPIVLHLSEHVSFLNKARIREKLSTIKSGSTVVIDATNSRIIDQDVLDVFEDFKIHAQETGIGFEYLPPKTGAVSAYA